MSFVLAIDVTADAGSIALSRGPELLEAVNLEYDQGFGHLLFVAIHDLLARHDVSLHDVACFAAAAGPGSFTGVRLGLTAAKGFAEGTGAKVAAISNLQALAWFGEGDLRAVYLDARRGEIYGAVYDARLRVVREEVVDKLESWLASIPSDVTPFTKQAPLAPAIAYLGWQQWEAGLARDPAEADANYVRRADAQMQWVDSN